MKTSEYFTAPLVYPSAHRLHVLPREQTAGCQVEDPERQAEHCVQVPALPLLSCAVLKELLSLTWPSFPHMWAGNVRLSSSELCLQ